MCEDSGYGTHTKPLTSSSDDDRAEDVGLVMSPVRGAPLLEERDIFDMLKWAFILRASEAWNNNDARKIATHEVWSELRESLSRREPIAKCCEEEDLQTELRRRGQLERADSLASCKNSCTAGSNNSSSKCSTEQILLESALDLCQENLLQSILPNLLVTPTSRLSGTETLGQAESPGATRSFLLSPGNPSKACYTTSSSSSSSGLRRKSISESNLQKLGRSSTDIAMESKEIIIHVCDDARDERRDFGCPQDLLLAQMGYFRDITSGQNLEDVDISVHCDITIFEWLMKWIKARENGGGGDEKTSPCEMNVDNILSILVSASFLKMDALVDVGLHFVHDNLNKILANAYNLSCLGEPLFAKLSNLYLPSQIEDVIDRRDRVTSKLYIKLIQNLFEAVPQPEREIYETAATLHRCRLCGYFLTETTAPLLPCLPHRFSINRFGEIIPMHKRDNDFNINDFLRALKSELRTWRKVFWRVWGMVHSLHCSLCAAPFPLYLYEFCSFHPQDPHFEQIPFQNATRPEGHFPCCGLQTLRFQVIPRGGQGGQGGQSGGCGCQQRDHRPRLTFAHTGASVAGEYEAAIHKMLMSYRDLICLSAVRSSKIKINADVNSVSLPRILNPQNPVTVIVEDDTERAHPSPSDERRLILNRNFWQSRKPPSAPTKPPMRKSLSSISLNNASSVKLAANRWKTIAYGRLKRAPKLPVKPLSSESSSSATDDLSEDSSSVEDDDDDDGDEEEDRHAGLEYALDTKNLSVEIKVAKDRTKGFGVNKSASSADLAGMNYLHPSGGDLSGLRSGRSSPSPGAKSRRSGDEEDKESPWMKWDNDRTTRSNQDNQRELETSVMREIVRHLGQIKARGSTKETPRSSDFTLTLGSSLRPRTWSNLSPATAATSGYGGSFTKLEQDWRETHLAYLQHRAVRLPSSQSTLRPPAALLGHREGRPSSASSLRSGRMLRMGAR